VYTFKKFLIFLDFLKSLSVIVFFVVISILTINLNNTITQIREDVRETKEKINSEISNIRQETFKTSSSLINLLNTRSISIENNLFSRLSSIENNMFDKLSETVEILDKNLQQTNSNLEMVAYSYSKVPELLEPISERMNCTDNDSCWPNLLTDVLIDTRNVTRAGTRTFLTVNQEIPKIAADINTVSEKLAEDIPKVTENAARITDNIERLTKPKWYDKFLAIAANGSIVWFNINRSGIR
jgi:macrodomain Ter protein organizer (MatP/YcbG family)